MFFSFEGLVSLLLFFLLAFSLFSLNSEFDFSLLQRFALVSDLVVLWSQENSSEEQMLSDSEKFLGDFCLIVNNKVLRCDNPDNKVFVEVLIGDAFEKRLVVLGS
ncbi:MAG: hypothetical protein QXZ13_00280 [Candidatus Diapherotrites archaeon]